MTAPIPVLDLIRMTYHAFVLPSGSHRLPFKTAPWHTTELLMGIPRYTGVLMSHASLHIKSGVQEENKTLS